MDIARHLTDIQEYPLDIYTARSKVGRMLRDIVLYDDVSWISNVRRVNANEHRFPKHFLPRHAPRQLKQTARRVSESAHGGKSKKNEKKIEEARGSDPLTILVDVSLSLSPSLARSLFFLCVWILDRGAYLHPRATQHHTRTINPRDKKHTDRKRAHAPTKANKMRLLIAIVAPQ